MFAMDGRQKCKICEARGQRRGYRIEYGREVARGLALQSAIDDDVQGKPAGGSFVEASPARVWGGRRANLIISV